MAQTHRMTMFRPLLGLACLPLAALATGSTHAAGVGARVSGSSAAAKAAPEQFLPYCTPGIAKGEADKGALGLYDIGGGKLAADAVDAKSAGDCLKATIAGLSLNIDGIALNLEGQVQYHGLSGTPQRVIRAETINPVLCESYLTGPSIYSLELRNSNNDILGPGGSLPGISSLRYQLATGAFEPQLDRAQYGPWVRCYDATLPNAVIVPENPEAVFGAGFESSSDVRVEFLDVDGNPITSGQMVSTIGADSVYKVRVSNHGEADATGVRVREFLPRASGPLTPTMTAVSCFNETIAQNCNVDANSALFHNVGTLAPGASVTYRLTRKVNGASPLDPQNGGLTSVAAFVDPDAVYDTAPANNSRRLQIGLVENGIPVANGGVRSTPEDTPFAITLSGTDPDGDAIVGWNVSTPPAHGQLTGTAPDLTYTPDADYFGADSFSYRVTDSRGGISAPATVSITITPVNDGPRILTQLGNVSYAEGASVEIDASAAFVDPEGDAFTVDVTGLPAGVQYFAGLRAIAGVLGLSSSGSYTVVLTATETATNLTASQEFTLLVTNTNQNPSVATPIADRNDLEGSVISTSIAANFTDPDAGDVLSFSVSAGALPPGLILAANGQISGTISQTAADGSPYSITIRADDGEGGTVDDTFEWTVEAVNAAPQPFGTISNRTGTVGTMFSISGAIIRDAFFDPDGDTLTYSAGTTLPPGVFINPEDGSIVGVPSDVGAYVVEITATDDGDNPGPLSTTQTFTISISPPPP